jgi:hypothetical protein
VTVRHMYAVAVAATPDYRGEQAMYIERTTTLLKALFFSP